jgi:hypothetical protein
MNATMLIMKEGLYKSLPLRSPYSATTLPGLYKQDAKRTRSEARLSKSYASDRLKTVASGYDRIVQPLLALRGPV